MTLVEEFFVSAISVDRLVS